jgi:hypothetical protein
MQQVHLPDSLALGLCTVAASLPTQPPSVSALEVLTSPRAVAVRTLVPMASALQAQMERPPKLGLINHFADADPAELYFGGEHLTKSELYAARDAARKAAAPRPAEAGH